MAYNSTTGSLHVGDLLNEDDEDTQVDFGYDSIIFRTNRLPRLQITNTSVSASATVLAGEVGIGTTSPEAQLHLKDGSAGTISAADGTLLVLESSEKPKIHFQSANAYGGSLIFGSVADNDEGQIDYDNGSDRFLFKTGGNTKMSILGDNVGIGVSDPDQKLEVAGAVHVSGEVSSPSAPSDGDGGILYVKSDGKLYWISDEISETDLTSGGGGISWDGSTANGVATFKDSDEATVESNLTFDGSLLTVAGRVSASLGLSGSSLIVGTATKYGLHWDGGLAISKMNTNWTNAGRTVADLGTVTTADINGGNLDGVVIGAAAAVAGTFGALVATASLSSSAGITGSSIQVGAYGWQNNGKIWINTLNLGGTNVSSTAAELNKLDGADSNVTAAKLSTLSALSDTEIGYVDGASAGSAVASKAVVYDAQKGITAQSVTGSVLSASYNLLTANLTASQGLKVSKDNQYIRIGAGEDLLLFHDSANSVIKNQTGHLIIDCNATDKHIRLKLGENDSTTQVQVRNNSDSTVLKIGADGALSASSGLSGSSLLVGTATKYGLHWDGGLAISKMNTNWTNAGRTIADLGIATTVDLRGGAIDGTTVGATNQSTGQFTTLSSSTFETARGATLGKNTGDRTRITGSFSVSGSVMGHQFFPTRHAYNTTATTMKFIPFYNLSEANAPNNATYINQMIVPFSGQLKRVYYRPSGSQNGNVSIALFKATNGNGDINMNEQGVLIETQTVSCPNAASTTTVFTFTGSNHYSAGEVVGVSVHPNANQVEVNLVCLWEYNIYGL